MQISCFFFPKTPASAYLLFPTFFARSLYPIGQHPVPSLTQDSCSSASPPFNTIIASSISSDVAVPPIFLKQHSSFVRVGWHSTGCVHTWPTTTLIRQPLTRRSSTWAIQSLAGNASNAAAIKLFLLRRGFPTADRVILVANRSGKWISERVEGWLYCSQSRACRIFCGLIVL